MKKLYKGVAAVLISAALITPLFGEGAATNQLSVTSIPDTQVKTTAREEVIYANLMADGKIKEIYAVNILEIPQAGIVTDYGHFTSLKNLTNTEEITLSNDQVVAKASEGRFYYQGTLKEQLLPWRFKIDYYLDGKKIDPSELAGQEGSLEIKVESNGNSAVDQSFFDNYLLQVAITLDASSSSNIKAEGGTIANAGENKLITYTVMPGNNGSLSVKADVIDFSMKGIEISAVPFSMMIDAPDTGDMTDNMSTLSEAIAALNDGIGKLEKGAAELNQGASELAEGSKAFNDGLVAIKGSSQQLIEGSSEVKNALNTIAASLQRPSGGMDLSALAQLPEGLSQLAAGLDGISHGLTQLKENYAKAYAALNSAILELPNSNISQQELTALYMANPGKKDMIDQLVAFYSAGQRIKGTYEAVNPAFAAVEGSLTEIIASNNTIAASLTTISTQIGAAMAGQQGLDQMSQLTEGLSKLSANYNGLHEGFIAYTGGVNQLAENYSQLNAGVIGTAGGTAEIHGGINQLHSGSKELSNGVKNMPQEIEKEIDKMLSQYDKSDFTPVSFVSDKNDGTKAVQFVIRAEAVEKVKVEEAPKQEAEKDNFWTRFLKLFRR